MRDRLEALGAAMLVAGVALVGIGAFGIVVGSGAALLTSGVMGVLAANFAEGENDGGIR